MTDGQKFFFFFSGTTYDSKLIVSLVLGDRSYGREYYIVDEELKRADIHIGVFIYA